MSMTETVTETFCERCGTRYTFEPPHAGGLARLRAASRGLRDYVLTDHRSLGDAMSGAVGSAEERDEARRPDSFQQMFSFCLGCREYVCPECWNGAAGQCISCAAPAGAGAPVAPTERAFDARESGGAPAAPVPAAGPDAGARPAGAEVAAEPGPEAVTSTDGPTEDGERPVPAPAPREPSASPADRDPGGDIEEDVLAAAIAAGLIRPGPGPVGRATSAAYAKPPGPQPEEPGDAAVASRLAALPAIGTHDAGRPVGRPSFSAAGAPPPWPSSDGSSGSDGRVAAAPAGALGPTAAAEPTAHVSGVPTTASLVPEVVPAIEPVEEPWPPAWSAGGPPGAAPDVRFRQVGRAAALAARLGAPNACVGCGLQLAAASRFCRRCGARQD
jgi:hypothetical protein